MGCIDSVVNSFCPISPLNIPKTFDFFPDESYSDSISISSTSSPATEPSIVPLQLRSS